MLLYAQLQVGKLVSYPSLSIPGLSYATLACPIQSHQVYNPFEFSRHGIGHWKGNKEKTLLPAW